MPTSLHPLLIDVVLFGVAASPTSPELLVEMRLGSVLDVGFILNCIVLIWINDWMAFCVLVQWLRLC